MELPLYSKFYRKLDAFTEIVRLDRQFNRQLSTLNDKNIVMPTWAAEKKILSWINDGHKKLGSNINSQDLGHGSDGKQGKLKDFHITWEESQSIGFDNILNNLVEHGFGVGSASDGVKFNQTAYLYSEVLTEAFSIGPARKTYKSKLKAKNELQRSKFFYFKYFASLLGIWYLLILAVAALALGVLDTLGIIDSLKSTFNFIGWQFVTIIVFVLPLLTITTLGVIELKGVLAKK